MFHRLIVLSLIGISTIFASNEHTYSINNVTKVAPNSIRFEIWLKNVSTVATDTIYVLSPTLNLDINNSIANGGTLSVTAEDISGYAKSLATENQPNAPIVDVSKGVGHYILRANGVTSSQNSTATPKNSQVNHYTLLPSDSVICAIYTISTTADTFAQQLVNLAFRPYGAESPVTSCSYFKRFDEGGTGYYCVKSGTKYTSPAMYTLSSITNEKYNNIGSSANLILPVELSSFMAIPSGRNANLVWRTASESNTSYFEIERSYGSTISWEKVGTVKAAGTSTKAKDYSFTDNKLNTGKYFYRLKVVDLDGTYRYSSEVENKVDAPKNYSISQNYPNPFNPSTRIEFQLQSDSKVVLELYSMTGEKKAELLNADRTAGYYSIDVQANALGLPSGVYIYRIIAKGKVQGAQPFISSKKMLLLK
jgi:hypothetical protein